MRQPHPKEQSHAAQENHNEKLRAHAVRKSDLLSASDNDSIGSFPNSWQQYHRHEGENRKPKSSAARSKDKHYSSYATAVNSVEQRQPLQDLNGHVSRTVLRDGASSTHYFRHCLLALNLITFCFLYYWSTLRGRARVFSWLAYVSIYT